MALVLLCRGRCDRPRWFSPQALETLTSKQVQPPQLREHISMETRDVPAPKEAKPEPRWP